MIAGNIASRVAKVALVATITATCFAAPVLWGSRHALTPGVQGCQTIRAADARVDCYATRLESSVSTTHTMRDLHRVDDLFDSKRSQADCHQAMHVVGRRLAPRLSEAVADDVARHGVGQCSAGFVHGMMEAAARSDPDRFVAVAIQRCAGGTLFAQTSCIHGVGHGLERADHTTALTTCRAKLPAVDRVTCLDGVYMERSIRVDPVGPATFCTAAPPSDAHACAMNVPNLAIRAGTHDTFRSMLSLCESLRGTIGQAACAYSAAAVLARIDDLPTCMRLGTARAREECTASLAQTTARVGSLQHTATVCAALGDAEARSSCAAGVGGATRARATSVRAAADQCTTLRLPHDLGLACQAGARLCWPRFADDPPATGPCPRIAVTRDTHDTRGTP